MEKKELKNKSDCNYNTEKKKNVHISIIYKLSVNKNGKETGKENPYKE